MSCTALRVGVLAITLAGLPVSKALAHCFVPATLATDDPCVADEMSLPTVNKESGSGVGVLAQLHLYLDDIFPNTYGQPLIGGQTSPAKRPFGG